MFREGFANVIVVGDPIGRDVFIEAADLYVLGRRRGYTIRSSTDCLIAAIAMRRGLPVWHRDRDFEHIARFTRLRTKPHWAVH